MHALAIARTAGFCLLVLTGLASAAAAQGIGIKGGPTFSKFSADSLDFGTRTGVQAGIFFGGNRDGIFGVQGELNWIRKNSEQLSEPLMLPSDPTMLADGRPIRVDYVQVPVLLRLNAGSSSPNGVALFGVAGPSFLFKVADEVSGFTIDNGFEGGDIGIVFGGGIEAARIIVEGRYEKGLRRINDAFNDYTEIKTQSFSVLFGIRFR